MRLGILLTGALVAGGASSCERGSHGSEGRVPDPALSAAPVPSLTIPVVESAPPTPPPSASPRPLPPAFVQAVVAAEEAIDGGDYAQADRALAAADAITGGDVHMRFVVARFRAARFAYAGDFKGAASAILAILPELAKHPELPDEFSAHNAMMMIRAALGDPTAALGEDDQATAAAARGTWAPEERETLAYLKDRWHRAYLTRMLAETRAGAERKALVAAATKALDDYRARARSLGTNEESIAVLEAYFAALDGRREAALAAARRVNAVKDDDIEDRYLVVIGLEAGGDHAAAEAVRRLMRQPGEVHTSRPIMLRWLEHDSKWPSDKTFTPWHPT
jgi:hypothetical protein